MQIEKADFELETYPLNVADWPFTEYFLFLNR